MAEFRAQLATDQFEQRAFRQVLWRWRNDTESALKDLLPEITHLIHVRDKVKVKRQRRQSVSDVDLKGYRESRRNALSDGDECLDDAPAAPIHRMVVPQLCISGDSIRIEVESDRVILPRRLLIYCFMSSLYYLVWYTFGYCVNSVVYILFLCHTVLTFTLSSISTMLCYYPLF